MEDAGLRAASRVGPDGEVASGASKTIGRLATPNVGVTSRPFSSE